VQNFAARIEAASWQSVASWVDGVDGMIGWWCGDGGAATLLRRNCQPYEKDANPEANPQGAGRFQKYRGNAD